MTLKVADNQYARYPSDSWASCFVNAVNFTYSLINRFSGLSCCPRRACRTSRRGSSACRWRVMRCANDRSLPITRSKYRLSKALTPTMLCRRVWRPMAVARRISPISRDSCSSLHSNRSTNARARIKLSYRVGSFWAAIFRHS